MTTDTITSVTLGVDLVKRLIQDHLNSQVLRCPHTVTDLDVVEESVTVVVYITPVITRLVPGGINQTTTHQDLAAELVATSSPTLPTNGKGNGHNGHNVQPATLEPFQPTPEVTQVGAPKRLTVTPEQDAEILRLHAEGWSEPKIAAELGIGKSTVHYRITRARKADGAA